jgi:hypothetical protein
MSDGTQTKLRVWHPARDAYHSAFRMLRIMVATTTAPMEFERLRILDLFLLSPSLLHRTKMPKEMRERFRTLNVTDPDELFERLPSNSAIFQELRVYQRTAASYLAARDIFPRSIFARGLVECKPANIPMALVSNIERRNTEQNDLIQFLANDFGHLPLSGNESLYKRAALPGRHLLS